MFEINIKRPDEDVKRSARRRWDRIAKPIDGLGRLEDCICRIAAIKGEEVPDISQKALVIMCADNGVTAEGVSQTSGKVTLDVARLMGVNRSSVGVMAASYPLEILPVDIGIDSDTTPEGVIDRKIRKGTADIMKEPAMTEDDCMSALSAGIELAGMCRDRGIGIIATGEMGIGNTTTSAALLCALTGAASEDVTGRGAGLTAEALSHKKKVVEEALKLHLGELGIPYADSPKEVFEVLKRLGGLDIAGLAGVFAGGAMYGIPVVIDGVISAAAALTAEMLIPGCRGCMIASHRGRERGAMTALDRLELVPVIDADLALGEGTGAVLLFPMLDMAMSLYRQGTVFGETDITAYRRFSS